MRAQPADRKTIWREQLLKLGLFKVTPHRIWKGSQSIGCPRKSPWRSIAMSMPSEDYEAMFENMIRWARFGDLFDYNEETEIISLPTPEVMQPGSTSSP